MMNRTQQQAVLQRVVRRPWISVRKVGPRSMSGLGENGLLMDAWNFTGSRAAVGHVMIAAALGAALTAGCFVFSKQLGLKKNPRSSSARRSTVKKPGARKSTPYHAMSDYNPTPAQEAAYRAYHKAEKKALDVWHRFGWDEPTKDPTYRVYSKAADKAWAKLVALHPSKKYATRQYIAWEFRNGYR